MAEHIEARDSMLEEWVDKRSDAWHDGYDTAGKLIDQLGMNRLPEGVTNNDRYLQYLFLQGVAQAFTNLAREVGNVNFGRGGQEDPQNKRRVPKT